LDRLRTTSAPVANDQAYLRYPDSFPEDQAIDQLRSPSMTTSVVFVHGLWLHADSWGAWAELFGNEGFESISPGWPGEPASVDAARKSPEAVAGRGIDDVVAHYAAAIAELESKPIAIGHSFGGLIVQRLLSQGMVAGAVALDPAPIKGVVYLPPSALRVASIALRSPANRKRSIALSDKQFRYGFANAVSEAESKELFDRWTIPSPMRLLFEAATANLNPGSPAKVDTRKSDRGPLLLIAGGADHTAPASITRATHKLYRKSAAVTDLHEFADRGHSLGVDSGWREVADYSLGWIRAQQF
jgi:non-heme chloroperoxidase